jgi:hypothetical protein
MKPADPSQITQTKENFSRFLRTLSLENPKLVKAEQIHGNKIAIVDVKDSGEEIKGADGLVAKGNDLFLVVFVADCLPILAFDPSEEIVGIAHAGWRGTVAKIAENLIKAFVKLGSHPEKIQVGLGPAIEFCHYEVGKELANKFKVAGLKESVLEGASGKIYLDLKQANIKQLKAAGVPKENMDVSLKACTYENPDFYSYRAEKENLSGEIACLIGLKNG